MPCKIRRSKHGETCSSSGIRKTKYACIVEADESTRKRLGGTLHKDHEDHIAGERNQFIETLQSFHITWCTSLFRCLKERKSRMRKLP